MKLSVLYFAQARDRAGCSRQELEMPAGSRVSDAIELLRMAHPALEPLWPHLAVAVDGRLAGEDEALTEGAEIALLPPVSGGRR